MTKLIALTDIDQVAIISAYSASNQQIPAVADEPGWFVIGDFFLPETPDAAHFEIIGVVSDDDLLLKARLFDLTTLEPVSGSDVELNETIDTRVVSEQMNLVGGRIYQVQAEVIGAVVDGFGLVKTASLSS